MDGSRALAAGFQNSIHRVGMSGDPRDINDSLARVESPALVNVPAQTPGFDDFRSFWCMKALRECSYIT